MVQEPEERAVAALFRMLSARSPGARGALFAAEDARIRLLAGGPGAAAASAETAEWRAISPEVAAALGRGAGVVPAEALGLAAPFCAVQALRREDGGLAGVFALCAGRPRRLAGALAATLADSAALAGPLLSAARGAPRPAATLPDAPPRRSPRAGAAGARVGRWMPLARLIEAGQDGGGTAALLLVEAAGEAEAAEARILGRLAAGDRIASAGGRRYLILTRRPAGAAAALAEALAEVAAPAGATARVGLVLAPPPGVPHNSVLTQAEAALRRSAPLPERRAPKAGRLEADLAGATRRGEMRLVYQGYVDLAAGRVSGVEALMRWRHPIRGELAPASFIPLAEATGLILPLGAWALRAALAEAARWPAALALSVNVSALQFHQPGFVAEVEAALAAAGVAPARLELEITETVLMRDNPETIAQLDALIARGVRIALDDFGTGYSALAYLGRLPHHRIKLDRSFVQDLGNPATLDLVQAILALAGKTGVAVTAEGVERPDQLALVRKLGFSHAQGFVTGPPVSDPTALVSAPAALQAATS